MPISTAEPAIGSAMAKLRNALSIIMPRRFVSSASYWDERYQLGGTSGAGSYGRLARHKADVLNDFVVKNAIRTVIEFGSGDGAQLGLAVYPDYLGVDVSSKAVDICEVLYANDPAMRFMTLDAYDNAKVAPAADLTLSLDVIYHLVEDATFNAYMERLFDAAQRFIIIYASNDDKPTRNPHVRHRRFSDWIDVHRQDWTLQAHLPNRYPFNRFNRRNTSFADFYIYGRTVGV